MTYLCTHKGFICYALGHGNGSYAVRDGVEPGRPNGGPAYAEVHADEDQDITGRIDDFLYYEAMDDADLMVEVADERRWNGGPATVELSRRAAVREQASGRAA